MLSIKPDIWWTFSKQGEVTWAMTPATSPLTDSLTSGSDKRSSKHHIPPSQKKTQFNVSHILKQYSLSSNICACRCMLYVCIHVSGDLSCIIPDIIKILLHFKSILHLIDKLKDFQIKIKLKYGFKSKDYFDKKHNLQHFQTYIYLFYFKYALCDTADGSKGPQGLGVAESQVLCPTDVQQGTDTSLLHRDRHLVNSISLLQYY